VLKEVDRAAKAAARAGESGCDRGFRFGKVGRQKTKLPGAASLFPAKGQVAVIKAMDAGTLAGSGTIAVFETELVNQELSPIELPGIVKFGEGIPILPGQTRGPADAWTARTA
jgi:hypothetical protein